MSDGNDTGGRRPGRPGRPPAGRGPGGGRPPFRQGGPGGTGRGRPSGFDDGRPARPRPERPAAGRPAPPSEDVEQAAASTAPASDRIAKVIARAGVASRRDAEAMIAEGRVSLNGETLSSPAVNVGPDDAITVDGERLPSRERTRLWLFHKPRGLVTTFRDPEGRPTVFEALPEDMPRVVAIGRLDINTEGLLLLTNDGGLAKVIAHPETGWTRRYRVRAHGDVTQAELDKLKGGVTIDGMEYGSVEATLDRVQGDNIWLTLGLREGKNREVKRILEHLGIQVNRLIRLSFGPFQLGELEQGLVEEVRTRVLKDQLGAALAAEAEVDFESPVREPIAPFGRTEKPTPRSPDRAPRPRTARPEGRFDPRGHHGDRAEGRPSEGRRGRAGEGGAPGKAGPGVRGRGKRPTVWRADADPDGDAPPRRPGPRREDPKAERMAGSARGRERVGAIDSPEGRRVLVERLVGNSSDDASRDRPARKPRRDAADRGADRPRGFGRPSGPPQDRGKRPEGRPGKPPFKGGGNRVGERPARGGGEERRGGFPARNGLRPGGSRPGGPPKRRGR